MPRKTPAPDKETKTREREAVGGRRAKRAADDEVAKRAADDEVAKRAADDEVAKRAADDEVAKRAAEAAPPAALDGGFVEPAATLLVDPPDHAATASAGPLILIELDSAVTGGIVADRFDISLRGRVVSPEPIEQVHLQIGERVISAASYGQPERAAEGAMPDGRPARQRGFQFNLPRPGLDASGLCAFQIVARTETGQEHAETYTVDFDAASRHVAVVSGPTALGIASGPARPHVMVYIEHATLDPDGLLSVSGWALAMGSILALQVYADEERVGKARHGDERADVAAAHPGFPNGLMSGYSLVCTLDPLDLEAVFIRVQVVCPNGFGQEVSVPIQRLARIGRPPRPVAPLSVPEPAADTRPSEPSAPLFNLLNQKPSYVLKTDFRIEDEPLIGLVLSMPAARAALPAPVPEPPPPPAPPAVVVVEAPKPSREIRMFCDAVTLTGDGYLEVGGWAVCALGVAQVRVLLDDNPVGLAAYGHDRPDVGAAFPEISHAGLSGFRFRHRVADRIDGEHSVRVVVRNLGSDEKEDRLKAVATTVAEPERIMPALLPAEAPPQVVDGFMLTEEQGAEFKFEMDSPKLVNGAVPELITGRLTIDGWLLSRSGVERFEVFLDEQRLGEMHYGLARQDVGAAFPEWPNAIRSGYAFHCPPRSLKDGVHVVRLAVEARNGVTIERSFQLTVQKSDENQEQSGIRRRVPRVEADMLLSLLDDLDYRPRVRFILRQDEAINMDALNRTLEALRLMMWDDWSVLLLATEARVAIALRIIVDETMPHLADRFTIVSPDDREAWRTPLATGESGRLLLHLPLLPGDEPGADTLLECTTALGRHPDAGLVYGDEVRISPVSGEREAFFKPDFSPDLLTATNYIGRPWAVTDSALAATSISPSDVFEMGEYDLVLRCVEQAGAIRHVPKLLCQRGMAAMDTPAQELAALQRMTQRFGMEATIVATPILGTWRLRREVRTKGKVSIIIPTCAAGGFIKTCLNSLRAKTTYANYEIIVIDNIPAAEATWKTWVRENADKVVDIPDSFNWSVFNNRATRVATGEFLLFLNDDITITQPDWLEALLEHAERPEVGIVGPQLLYPDGKVQHAGMFLANNGIGRHAFRFAAHDDPCYFGLALTQRNVMAVTGACMLVRKAVFEDLGRFDEAHEIVNNDLDFCLRVHQAGLRTVFTPYATMTHHELASRAMMKDVFDLTQFNALWLTTFAAGDPYFNPRLWRHADDYRPDDEPVQWVVSGSPLFHPSEIKRILVVKLDHIGDFVTALPPIRRLKSLFPEAHITVLAGPASRAFVALEPAIDAFIPFAFFHARSQLGERDLTKDDYNALGDQLRPHRFDLAVDLRKHPSTRDVLKYAGARFLAGFDYQGQYPHLDIALDWDGDRTLQRKRSHIVVDLMALVNAIGHAAEPDRVLMKAQLEPMPRTDMPDDVAALFAKPVVAVHPGAGNVTKQWPEAHFAALIDLLIERNGVNVMLVGGPDEVEIADAVMAKVLHAESIASMTGKTSLAALPALLRTCVLYIGNDSGPKHIAAAVGIPTIGVHSGVVDPVEWGPIGLDAVALRRNMTCSPCYLAKAEDCPRGLACLRALEPNLVYETADLLLARLTRDQMVKAKPAERPRKTARRSSVKGPPQTADTA
jgi:ADP-heptose:LPS heptosyltransferase/GT2 family glycosyltransferase